MGESKGSSNPSEVKKCKCNHEFQDKQYGYQNRLHNPNGKGDYKCTVCGDVKKGK